MSNGQPETIVDVIEPTGSRIFNFRELWRHRELFYFFTWRDIKIKYKQTALGFLWAVLQPLMLMLIFSLFFGRVLKIETHGLPYPVYVFSGLLVWNIFSVGLTNASNSMVNNATIITKIYFPRLIIPVSSVLVSLFDFVMAFVLFVPILIYYGQPVSWVALWAWPTATFMAAVGTLGIGCWLGALNVKYRDFRYVIPFLIQVLFFTSPVIYPLTLIQYPWLRYAVASSPVYAAIELFRMPMTGTLPDPLLMSISIGSCVGLLVIGLSYFRSTQRFFADFA
jgi:lipopolysaccharide transport system permease protein